MENKSETYFNGSCWKSNGYGSFEIISVSNRKNYFICKFEDKTIVEASMTNIKEGLNEQEMKWLNKYCQVKNLKLKGDV